MLSTITEMSTFIPVGAGSKPAQFDAGLSFDSDLPLLRAGLEPAPTIHNIYPPAIAMDYL